MGFLFKNDPQAGEDIKLAFERPWLRGVRDTYQALFDLSSDYNQKGLVSLESISISISSFADLRKNYDDNQATKRAPIGQKMKICADSDDEQLGPIIPEYVRNSRITYVLENVKKTYLLAIMLCRCDSIHSSRMRYFS